MKTIWRRWKIEIVIVSIIFGVRFLYSVILQYFFGSDVFISYLDAAVFLREAGNLVSHGAMSQFPDPPFLPDPLRTPLYLLFLAFFALLHAPLIAIVTAQNILAGIVGILIYRIGKDVLHHPVSGMVAAVLYGLEPASIYWNNMLMSDNLFVFLFVLAVYFLLQKRWYMASFSLGLATLTRPIGLYFFPLFGLMALVDGQILSRLDWRRIALRAKNVLVMSLLLALVLFPWMLRNKILFNTWELSSAGWLNLYIFTMKEFAARRGIDLPMPSMPDGYHTTPYAWVFYNYEFSSVEFYKKHSLQLVAQYPFEYFLFHVTSGLKSLGNHDYYYLVNYVLLPEVPFMSQRWGYLFAGMGQAFWLIVYLGAAVGFIEKRGNRVKLFLVAIALLNAVLIGYNGIISSGGRYQLPLIPFMFLLGSYGAFAGYRKIRAISRC